MDALSLHRRNEVRSDGLTLDCVSNRLEIRWHARDVHPWDRGLPKHEREAAFVQQLLDDTEAAVLRLFDRLPQVDEIDVKVLDQESNAELASGIVQRTSLPTNHDHRPSVRMRLAALGIQCHFARERVMTSDVSDCGDDSSGAADEPVARLNGRL